VADQRVSYWDGVRDELRKARTAASIEARDFHLERAGEHADRLADTDVPAEIRHWGSSHYLEQAMSDIGWDPEWTIPLSVETRASADNDL
jgi:hypothetical protein